MEGNYCQNDRSIVRTSALDFDNAWVSVFIAINSTPASFRVAVLIMPSIAFPPPPPTPTTLIKTGENTFSSPSNVGDGDASQPLSIAKFRLWVCQGYRRLLAFRIEQMFPGDQVLKRIFSFLNNLTCINRIELLFYAARGEL